jgi:hypothetical protein
MQVGDLVVYRWWHGDAKVHEDVAERAKPEVGIIVDRVFCTDTTSYARIYVAQVDQTIDVPMFKLEAMNRNESRRLGKTQ